MNKSDMLFALLRKSRTVLKDGITTNNDRKFLINIKYEYSKLDSSLRNLMRIMATDIDRFETVYGSDEVLSKVLLGTGTLEPKLIDTKTGTTFTIKQNSIDVDSITVFNDTNHKGFAVAFHCLIRAKKHLEETMIKHTKEQERLDILTEYR
jgi:hypothetical protein